MIDITIGARKFQYSQDFNLEDDKVLKAKLKLTRDGQNEGIWMYVHPEDVTAYESDVHDLDFIRLGILVNQSICGIPWGAYIPYKLAGKDRPVAVFEKVIDVSQPPQFHPEMWRRTLEGIPSQLIAAFNHCMDHQKPDYCKGWIEWAQGIHDDEKSKSHTELLAKLKETIEQCSIGLSVQQKV